MVTTLPNTIHTDEQLTRFTGYPVTLPVFEGPLDLLLYLIKRQELNIYDIPIAKITGQFLDYLTLMEELDIELCSEFLVMAATLLEIKSRLLLPRPPVVNPETDEVEEEDPRAELVRKLLEYQQYKSAAGELQRLGEEYRRCFPRATVVPNLPFPRPEPMLAGNPDAFSLWTALQKVLARLETAGPTVREVARPKVTIRQQMVLILRLLEDAPSGLAFTAVFQFDDRTEPLTRVEVIITFLAMLELMRLHRVAIRQDELFGEIYLVLRPAQPMQVA